MKNIIFFILLVVNNLTWAQFDSQLESKFGPLVFQVEKQLASQIKQTLDDSLKIKEVSIRVNLKLDLNRIKKKYDLESLPSGFNLPGLDESSVDRSDKIKKFKPSLQDVFANISALHVFLGSMVDFNEVEKLDIKRVILDDFSTLGLNSLELKFFRTKNLEPLKLSSATSEVVPQPSEEVSVPLVKDGQVFEEDKRLFPVYIGLTLAVLFIVVVIWIGYMLQKRLSVVNQSMKDSINQQHSVAPVESQYLTSTSSLKPTADDIENTIQKAKNLFHDLADKSDFLTFVLVSFDPGYFYALSQLLNNRERGQIRQKLNSLQEEQYKNYLNDLAKGLLNPNELLTYSQQVKEDLSLFTHDPNVLFYRKLSRSIEKLSKEKISDLLRTESESAVSCIVELTHPQKLAEILSEEPDILSRFQTLVFDPGNNETTHVLYQKINDSYSEEALREESRLPVVSLYLSPEIEHEFNSKFGVQTTHWDNLGDKSFDLAFDFILSLSIRDASSFMAILPKRLAEDILEKLPDLKKEQISRLPLVISPRSRELKKVFFESKRRE